ncbi:MAG TPA: hypothetical protein VN428_02400 [Bryobacteraceae bacterium]|nr:hypothetical protein [Bryobacteraceae bacterium]
MALHTSSSPILPQRKGGVSVADLLMRLRQKDALVAEAFSALANEVNYIGNALRSPTPSLEDITVTAPDGRPIARIGSWVDGDTLRSGLWAGEFYQGGDGPETAIVYSDETGRFIIGRNGSATVLDPFGNSAAWIGTQWDTVAVTGAVDSGTGLIRLTVVGHPFITGDELLIAEVGGIPNATGIWTVTVVDANHIDLDESGFAGLYTSGGWVSRLLHVTGAVNNGSGLVRLTVTAHGYESGDKANVQNVGGVPAATGQWTVTVVDANTLDLDGSAFAGAYTSGGTCVRYFAGGLFQNVAVGPSFDDYRLRAFPDGTLRIKDAEIVLDGSEATITLDPDAGLISVVGKNAYDVVVEISSLQDSYGSTAGVVIKSGASPSSFTSIGYEGVSVRWNGDHTGVLLGSGAGGLILMDGAGVWTTWFSMSGDGHLDGSFDAWNLKIGGIQRISNLGNASFLSVSAAGFSVSGLPGINLAQNIVTAVVPVTSTLNYKDHAGANQTMTVVTGLTVTTNARTFTEGLITA